MKMYLALLPALLSLLTACGGSPVRQMPVQILSAPADHAQLTEVLPVEQVLRPQDVLDVIYHLGATSEGRYRLQPGDEVEVTFMTAPELSGPRLIMPDGTLDMPYVGNVEVADLTAEAAQARLVERYAKVLRTPRISFSVTRPMAQMANLRVSLQHPSSGMTREIVVGSDGRASFPLIGAMSLQGMTLAELNRELNERYASQNSQIGVDVLLKRTEANQVFVLGEVGQPGAFPVRRPVSVLEALTLASGPRIGARLDSVVILRRNGDQVEARVYDAGEALSGKAPVFAYLQPDDMLYVPKTRLARAGELSRQLADVVLFQGVGFSFAYRVDDKDNITRTE